MSRNIATLQKRRDQQSAAKPKASVSAPTNSFVSPPPPTQPQIPSKVSVESAISIICQRLSRVEQVAMTQVVAAAPSDMEAVDMTEVFDRLTALERRPTGTGGLTNDSAKTLETLKAAIFQIKSKEITAIKSAIQELKTSLTQLTDLVNTHQSQLDTILTGELTDDFAGEDAAEADVDVDAEAEVEEEANDSLDVSSDSEAA